MKLKLAILFLFSFYYPSSSVTNSGQKATFTVGNRELPLIITNAVEDTLPMFFLFSGDGGWKSFDANLTSELAKYHIPSIGINCNSYFWKKKTPKETASDIAPLLRKYLKLWNKKEPVFSGYSFGAEVMPFVYNQLPPDLMAKVRMVVSLTTGDFSDFEIHLNDMLGFNGKNYPYLVSDEIKKINSVPVIIFWGEKEKAEFASTIKQENIKVYFIAGNHNFTDHKTIVSVIMHSLNKTLTH